jgi:hypothetical protein
VEAWYTTNGWSTFKWLINIFLAESNSSLIFSCHSNKLWSDKFTWSAPFCEVVNYDDSVVAANVFSVLLTLDDIDERILFFGWWFLFGLSKISVCRV